MVINGEYVTPDNLSLDQLLTINNSIDTFLFQETGEEKYEPTFKNDPKQFKRLISRMVTFKSDIMRLFALQYKNRFQLIRINGIKADEYDEYLYPDQWDIYDDQITQILEKHTKEGYDLGALALAIGLNISYDHTSLDAQGELLKRAQKVAKQINDTTKKRAVDQMKTSLGLGETREALDQRLKRVFTNPYRGRFIAEQETLNAYMDGKEGLAINLELTYKTALSSQAIDSICGDVNGETRPVNDPFSNGFMRPLYHFGCKCDISYHRNPDGI